MEEFKHLWLHQIDFVRENGAGAVQKVCGRGSDCSTAGPKTVSCCEERPKPEREALWSKPHLWSRVLGNDSDHQIPNH